MTPLPDILAWVASHSSRLSRAGYTAPNHLANGEVRWFGTGGATFARKLDGQGRAPKDYTIDPPPSRIEIYASNGDLLFTEQA